ncbi:MAG TPA: DNA recombination protein RmuC [Candidatus Polarisedimenticolaceae bacterium]|nr:DNA recombination protein RmuC [Candidatus Polarisedimenticolaceae bacterium]
METVFIAAALVVLALIGASIYIGAALRRALQPPAEDKSMLLLQEQLGKLTERMDDRMDKSNQQMRQVMHQQFTESSKLITEVTQSLVKLQKGNEQVVDVADRLQTLQNVLQNPKQRGVLGEYYLQQVLENMLSPSQFSLQYKFQNGDAVDAVIHLDTKILPIDSKFSLENYNRLVEEKDATARDVLIKSFKADLKNRIDETAKYIRPSEDTMDFAFMFIPSEAVYYDLLINKVGTVQTTARDLIEYAFRDKHVIIVSPTSFMAYLQTVLQGLRSLQIEEQAKEIQKRVGELGRHLSAYELFMQKLGNSLGTTVNHYNNAHKELGKVDKDVMRIAETSPGIEPLVVDKPQTDE